MGVGQQDRAHTFHMSSPCSKPTSGNPGGLPNRKNEAQKDLAHIGLIANERLLASKGKGTEFLPMTHSDDP